MSDKFAIKLTTVYALHKYKVIQNKKHILSLISEYFKKKLEQMIWQDVIERTIQERLFIEACTLDTKGPINLVLSTALLHQSIRNIIRQIRDSLCSKAC